MAQASGLMQGKRGEVLGVANYRSIARSNAKDCRAVTIDEVGNSAPYFSSDLSCGVTGGVHHVDCGYHAVGVKRPDTPDISPAKE